MTKTILVPIDFCVASLNTLKLALELYEDDKVEILLMYSEYTSDSITELLFYRPYRILSSKVTAEFNEALEMIKNRYEATIQNLSVKLFHGYNKRTIVSFLSVNKVDTIFIPKTYKLRTADSAFDPIPLLKKTTVPIFELDWSADSKQTEQEHLLSLFN